MKLKLKPHARLTWASTLREGQRSWHVQWLNWSRRNSPGKGSRKTRLRIVPTTNTYHGLQPWTRGRTRPRRGSLSRGPGAGALSWAHGRTTSPQMFYPPVHICPAARPQPVKQQVEGWGWPRNLPHKGSRSRWPDPSALRLATQVLKWGTFTHIGLTGPWTGQHECQPMWTKAACLCFRSGQMKKTHSGQMKKKFRQCGSSPVTRKPLPGGHTSADL